MPTKATIKTVARLSPGPLVRTRHHHRGGVLVDHDRHDDRGAIGEGDDRPGVGGRCACRPTDLARAAHFHGRPRGNQEGCSPDRSFSPSTVTNQTSTPRKHRFLASSRTCPRGPSDRKPSGWRDRDLEPSKSRFIGHHHVACVPGSRRSSGCSSRRRKPSSNCLKIA